MIIRIAATVLLGGAGLAGAAEENMLRDRQGNLGNVVPQLVNALGLAPSPSGSARSPTGQRTVVPSVTDSDFAPPTTTAATTTPGGWNSGGLIPISNVPIVKLPNLGACPLTPVLELVTCLDPLGIVKTLLPSPTSQPQITTTPTTTTTRAPQEDDTETTTTTARTTQPPSLPDCLDLPTLLDNPVSCLSKGIATIIFPSSTTQTTQTTTQSPAPNPGPAAPILSSPSPSPSPTLPNCPLPNLNLSPTTLTCLENGTPTVILPPLGPILSPPSPTTTAQPTSQPGNTGAPWPAPAPTTTPAPVIPQCPLLIIPDIRTTITCEKNRVVTTVNPVVPGPPWPTTTRNPGPPGGVSPPAASSTPTPPTGAPRPSLPQCPDNLLGGLENPVQAVTCLVGTVTSVIGGGATSAIGGLTGGATSAVEGVVGGATSAVGGVIGGATPAVEGVIGGATSAVEGVIGGATSAVEGVIGGATSAVEGVIGGATTAIGGVTSVIGGGTSVIGGIASDIGSIIAPTNTASGHSSSETLAAWVPIIVSNVLSGTLAPLPAQTGTLPTSNAAAAPAATPAPAAYDVQGTETTLPAGSNTMAAAINATGDSNSSLTSSSTTSSAVVGAAEPEDTSSSTSPAGSGSSSTSASSTDSTLSATTTTSGQMSDQEQTMMSVAEYICLIFGCGGAAATGKDATVGLTVTAPATGSTITLSSIITTTADPSPAQTQTVTYTEQPVQTRPVDSSPLQGFYGAGHHSAPPLLVSCLAATGAALFFAMFHNGIFA